MTNDDWGTDKLDENLLAQASGLTLASPQEILAQGGSMQKTGGQYATAIKVQNPRDLNVKCKQLLAEARIAGEAFYYGWGSGKDRVIGPSVGLAMAAARVWGNCAVEPAPLQETKDAWVMTMTFIDLETGFTVGRQFRQDKTWTISGKFDAARKDDMRFQIGQSKASRNVILNAIPKWLIDMAMKEAMAGVREKVEKFIDKKGLAAAQDLVIDSLAKHGITEEAILEKMKVTDRKGLKVDHIVALRGDLYCLDEGQDRATELFPAMKAQDKGTASKLNDQLDGDAPPAPPAPTVTPPAPTETQPARRETPPAQTETPPAQRENPPAPTETPEPDETPTIDDLSSGGIESEPLPPEPPQTASPYPDGFLQRLAELRAVGQVQDDMRARRDSGSYSDAMLAAMQAKADERIAEIRNAYRSI